ncbi:MAG: RNA-directed DNA polymerase [bacterium]|nr:RNA-directed DNA polymerase [bacterium]
MANYLFNFQKLYKAYLDCRRRKSNTLNAIRFEQNLESNLLALERELKNKTYRPGRSICFVVTDPVPREIFAADFRDRVVHHLLIKKVEPLFQKKFIFQSFACQKGKGTHLAVKYLEREVRRITCNFRREAYYLKLDISGFFMSIDQKILFDIFSKTISQAPEKFIPFREKEEILWLAKIIIFSKPTENYLVKGDPELFSLIPPHKSLFHSGEGRGLPIGNLTSQFFANVYLNELDHFIKRELKCRYYCRYVDDFTLLAEDINTLKYRRLEIEIFLRDKLRLKLHPRKQVLQSVGHGIDFVGYFIKPYHTLIRNRTVRNLKRNLFKFNLELEQINIPDLKKLEQILSTINSYYGFLRHSHSLKLRRHIYEKHFGRLKDCFFPINYKYEYFKIRYAYRVKAKQRLAFTE